MTKRRRGNTLACCGFCPPSLCSAAAALNWLHSVICTWCYRWLSLRKKGEFESNNCICMIKFSRSQMGGLGTICSWQTMSPWANFFIFLCLAFTGITGELKNELGKSTNLRNVYLKRFRTVTYIRSQSTIGRKPDCTECKWILALFSSYFLSSKHKSSDKVNLVICIILNRSVTGIDLIFFLFRLIRCCRSSLESVCVLLPHCSHRWHLT